MRPYRVLHSGSQWPLQAPFLTLREPRLLGPRASCVSRCGKRSAERLGFPKRLASLGPTVPSPGGGWHSSAMSLGAALSSRQWVENDAGSWCSSGTTWPEVIFPVRRFEERSCFPLLVPENSLSARLSSPASFAGICPLEPDVVGEPPATSAYPCFSRATGSVCATRGHQRLRTRRPIPILDPFRLSHACSCCPLRPAARVYRSPRARPAGSGNAQDPRLQGAAASRRTGSPPRSSLPLACAQSASQRSQPETSPASVSHTHLTLPTILLV